MKEKIEIEREKAHAMIDSLFCEIDGKALEVEQAENDIRAFKAEMLDNLLQRSDMVNCESAWIFGYLDALKDIFKMDGETPFEDLVCDADCRNCPNKENCEDSYT